MRSQGGDAFAQPQQAFDRLQQIKALLLIEDGEASHLVDIKPTSRSDDVVSGSFTGKSLLMPLDPPLQKNTCLDFIQMLWEVKDEYNGCFREYIQNNLNQEPRLDNTILDLKIIIVIPTRACPADRAAHRRSPSTAILVSPLIISSSVWRKLLDASLGGLKVRRPFESQPLYSCKVFSSAAGSTEVGSSLMPSRRSYRSPNGGQKSSLTSNGIALVTNGCSLN